MLFNKQVVKKVFNCALGSPGTSSCSACASIEALGGRVVSHNTGDSSNSGQLSVVFPGTAT